MSAIFAAIAPIAAGRSNAAISARGLRWKRSCPSRPLPACFPGSPAIFFLKAGRGREPERAFRDRLHQIVYIKKRERLRESKRKSGPDVRACHKPCARVPQVMRTYATTRLDLFVPVALWQKLNFERALIMSPDDEQSGICEPAEAAILSVAINSEPG